MTPPPDTNCPFCEPGLREAAREALEALELSMPGLRRKNDDALILQIATAITSLRTALSTEASQPVAEASKTAVPKVFVNLPDGDNRKAHVWFTEVKDDGIHVSVGVYPAEASKTAVEMLTDEEMKAAWLRVDGDSLWNVKVVAVLRAAAAKWGVQIKESSDAK